ncbi:flagellar basal body protein [Sphingomonas colocasiae]|uniref:Flagellar basal body protein n=1 Tax=Sphingomonas colocasiae TaxID=1848973 RepID=A0ABS7PW06_9SPHN|nr:flagellar basal body rod C-terminal domain-containing protein [Sphingomonas colocasiae]MBY8825550.1 flagellar basal body protein [Sphingomonas colocasiae]
MAGVSELAIATIQSAQHRIELIANNVSNINTPGFRSSRVFQQVVDSRSGIPESMSATVSPANSPVMRTTDRPLDIAVAGSAFLLLRQGDRLIPVSSAQLHLDANKQLVDDHGRILQSVGGGDLVVSASNPQILQDGTILVGGQPEGRVGLFVIDPTEAANGASRLGLSVDAAPPQSEDAIVRQGMIIPSDVDLSVEMANLTQASRMAETGARIFKVADELLGSAASKLGDLR